MHSCKLIPTMDSWKCESMFIKCRCGFCGAMFTNWQERCDHISKEFRSGKRMKDWKGCRGLDPGVASHVQNAMPPYLIANEAKSPFPFSASNTASLMQHSSQMAHYTDLEVTLPSTYEFDPSTLGVCTEGFAVELNEMNRRMSAAGEAPGALGSITRTYAPTGLSTCWEVLTIRLGKYVKDEVDKGHIPSDDELQRQARIILYGEDDSWNQTAADNLEWLALFRKAHGIGDCPDRTITRGALIEDLHVDIGELNFNNVFGQESGWGDVAAILEEVDAMDVTSTGLASTFEIKGTTGGFPVQNVSI